VLRLRWLAKEIGFEKIVLKNDLLIGYFISNQESEYYNSEYFTRVLKYVQKNPDMCRMKEVKNKLTLSFHDVTSIFGALEILREI